MKTIRKIVFLFAIGLSILIFREFLSIYSDLANINEYWGYAFLIVISLTVIYFGVLPFIRILLMPKMPSPTNDKSRENHIRHKRLKNFKRNPLLRNLSNYKTDEEKYYQALVVLKQESNKIRKNYIPKVFYSTTIAQNGFLDALIVLSACINLVKEIFILYNGRVSIRDLASLSTKIYTAVAVGGSETVEYATEEVISKLTSDGLQSIPFANVVAKSITDGYVNAMLVTRISLIAENYCSLVYIDNDKELYPDSNFVIDTTKVITKDIMDVIWGKLKEAPMDKLESATDVLFNPAGLLIKTAFKFDTDNKINPEFKQRVITFNDKITVNPIRMFRSIRKKIKNRN